MIWFLTIFVGVSVSLFIASIYMIKLRQRREKDAAFDEKLKRIESKIDPYYNFFVNTAVWGLALFLLIYLYLR